MKLIHVTAKANLDSILEQGLLPSKATQKRRAVWAVTPSNEAWAINHTLGKKRAKGLSIHDHVVIVLNVPRSWLIRHAKGVWYCPKIITKERFLEIREASGLGEDYPR